MMSNFLVRLYARTLATSFVFMVATAAVQGQEKKPAGKPFPLSDKRIGIVVQVVESFVEEPGFEGKSPAEVYDLVTARLGKAGIRSKLRPSQKLITQKMCRDRVVERTEEVVAGKVPKLDMEKLEAEAAEKYPMLKKGDQVVMHFMPNPARRVKVEGTYENFDGKNFIINYRRYPKESVEFEVPAAENAMDLVDEDQNARKRQRYIAGKRQKVTYDRAALRDKKHREFMREEVRQAIKTNEKNGYVFYQHQWHSLKDVVANEIDVRYKRWLAEKKRQELEAKRKAEEEARLKAEEEARLKAEEGEAPPENFEDMPPPEEDGPVPAFKDFKPVPQEPLVK